MMMALRSLPTLLLLCSLTLASHVKVHDCDVQSAYVGDQSQGLPKSDLSNPNLTTDHEPMAIVGCFDLTGLTRLQVTAGVFNATMGPQGLFVNSTMLENHGNSTATSCKSILLTPPSQHTITQIEVLSDPTRVRGLILTFADSKIEFVGVP